MTEWFCDGNTHVTGRCVTGRCVTGRCATRTFSCTSSNSVITGSSRTRFHPLEILLLDFSNKNIIINRIQRRNSRFLQSPHNAANSLQYVRSSGPGAIVCKSRATHRALITCKCHVTCHLVRRDSSAIKFDGVEIAFI